MAVLLDHPVVVGERDQVRGPVLEAQRQVDQVRERGGVLEVARVGAPAEHAHRTVREMGALVDVVDVGQSVGVVQHADAEAGDHDHRQRDVRGRQGSTKPAHEGRHPTKVPLSGLEVH